ncbi:glycoside hydrolase family 28 protein [Hyaloscypha variabilis]
MVSLVFIKTQLSGHVGPLTSISAKASHKVCNVEDYGAKNGSPSVDFGPPFADAWADCKDGGLVWIPSGEWFMQTAVSLDHGSATAVQLDGTIYRYAAITGDEMILIENGNDVEFFSGNSQGAVQGYGYQYLSQGEYGIRLMRIQNTENFSVHGFALVDSPSYYLTLDTCTNGEVYNLIMRGVTIGETDAIDVWGSNMYIHDIEVTNGDECVTTKSPAENFLIEDVYCNISGGCSIGSLGLDTDISNVYYHQIYCNQADPAFLKTNGGSGTVMNMMWNEVIFYGAAYPLSIDSSWGTSDGGNGIQMTNFTYKSWHGTEVENSRSVIRLNCPPDYPCSELSLSDIYVWTESGDYVTYTCENSFGSGGFCLEKEPSSGDLTTYTSFATNTVAPSYMSLKMAADHTAPFPSTTSFTIPLVPTSFYPGATPASALLNCDTAGCL